MSAPLSVHAERLIMTSRRNFTLANYTDKDLPVLMELARHLRRNPQLDLQWKLILVRKRIFQLRSA